MPSTKDTDNQIWSLSLRNKDLVYETEKYRYLRHQMLKVAKIINEENKEDDFLNYKGWLRKDRSCNVIPYLIFWYTYKKEKINSN